MCPWARQVKLAIEEEEYKSPMVSRSKNDYDQFSVMCFEIAYHAHAYSHNVILKYIIIPSQWGHNIVTLSSLDYNL